MFTCIYILVEESAAQPIGEVGIGKFGGFIINLGPAGNNDNSNSNNNDNDNSNTSNSSNNNNNNSNNSNDSNKNDRPKRILTLRAVL